MILQGTRLFKTHGGYKLEKQFNCINGLSAWFTLAYFPEPSEKEVGYTDGAIPSAKEVADAVFEMCQQRSAKAVTAKMLPWVSDGRDWQGLPNELVCYCIVKLPSGWELRRSHGGMIVESTMFDQLSEAKAAAQADFDRRIRSSISPSVAKESGEP